MFRRDTGFDTAYVGSSNLSRAALLDGVEWNVRLSRSATPALLEKFAATFDTYWNDASFETYDPDRDRDGSTTRWPRPRADDSTTGSTISLSGLEVRPFPYQQRDARGPRVERSSPRPPPQSGGGRDRHRQDRRRRPGLPTVCASRPRRATVAAVRRAPPGDPRAVAAHLPRGAGRRHVRRAVRRRQPSGAVAARLRQRPVAELPTAWRTSQRPLRRRRHRRVPPRRGRRPTAACWTTSTPRELLGLTATPERTDGVDVRDVLRRPHRARAAAVGRARRRPAVPFHYFGVADDVDLRRCRVEARALRRRRAVQRLHRQRRPGRKVLHETARQGHRRPARCGRSGSASASRTPSTWPTCSTGPGSRASRRQRQAHRRPIATEALRRPAGTAGQRLFAVDLFNEGLDLPRGRHRAVPATHGERDGLPPAARPWPATGTRQGRADRAGLHRYSTTRVPLRRQLRALTGADPARPRADDRARLPVPAVGLPDRAGPRPRPSSWRTSRRRSPTAGRRWCRAPVVRRPRPRDLPRASPGSSSPTSSRGPLVDPAPPGRRPARRAPAPSARTSC